MAERAGQQLCAADFKRFTVSVLCADGDVHRALDHAKLTREREAALCAVLLAGGFDDFRVDKLNAALADIDNDDTAQQTDLRCSKADAVCVLHRLVHSSVQSFSSNFSTGRHILVSTSSPFFTIFLSAICGTPFL